jgi:hypothetical protein
MRRPAKIIIVIKKKLKAIPAANGVRFKKLTALTKVNRPETLYYFQA